MKEYIITIAIAASAASFADLLAPKEWEKYIRLIIGFLILSVIIAPIAKFKNVEIISPTASYEISEEPIKDEVSKQLKDNIEKDIEDRMQDEFNLSADVSVELGINENHSITDVHAICIKTWKNPPGMLERIKEIYGCDKIELKFE